MCRSDLHNLTLGTHTQPQSHTSQMEVSHSTGRSVSPATQYAILPTASMLRSECLILSGSSFKAFAFFWLYMEQRERNLYRTYTRTTHTHTQESQIVKTVLSGSGLGPVWFSFLHAAVTRRWWAVVPPSSCSAWLMSSTSQMLRLWVKSLALL